MPENAQQLNRHGVPVTMQRIFSWDAQDRYLRGRDVFQAIHGHHMQLARALFLPGSVYEMHSHPHEQFSLLLSGRLDLTVGDETTEIGPGDGWYVPGGVAHGGQILGDEPVEFIDVYSPATQWVLELLADPCIRRMPAESVNRAVRNQPDRLVPSEHVGHDEAPSRRADVATPPRIFRWSDHDTYVRGRDRFQLINGRHMQMLRVMYPPGALYPTHSHPHEQFSLMLAGRMLVTVGNETREIGAGDGWHAPCDVEHGGRVLGDEPVEFIDVYSPASEWIVDLLSGPGIRDVPAGTRTVAVHNQIDEFDVYIGREVPEAGLEASKWGNPFVMADDSDGERRRAIAEYRAWIVEQPELMASIGELRGLRLGCWCAPQSCHGDVLAELADRHG